MAGEKSRFSGKFYFVGQNRISLTLTWVLQGERDWEVRPFPALIYLRESLLLD